MWFWLNKPCLIFRYYSSIIISFMIFNVGGHLWWCFDRIMIVRINYSGQLEGIIIPRKLSWVIGTNSQRWSAVTPVCQISEKHKTFKNSLLVKYRIELWTLNKPSWVAGLVSAVGHQVRVKDDGDDTVTIMWDAAPWPIRGQHHSILTNERSRWGWMGDDTWRMTRVGGVAGMGLASWTRHRLMTELSQSEASILKTDQSEGPAHCWLATPRPGGNTERRISQSGSI